MPWRMIHLGCSFPDPRTTCLPHATGKEPSTIYFNASLHASDKEFLTHAKEFRLLSSCSGTLRWLLVGAISRLSHGQVWALQENVNQQSWPTMNSPNHPTLKTMRFTKSNKVRIDPSSKKMSSGKPWTRTQAAPAPQYSARSNPLEHLKEDLLSLPYVILVFSSTGT